MQRQQKLIHPHRTLPTSVARCALIVVGGIFGLFWFWTLVLPILGIIVLIGVCVSAVSGRVARTDPAA